MERDVCALSKVREGFLEEVTFYLFFCISLANSVPVIVLGIGDTVVKI